MKHKLNGAEPEIREDASNTLGTPKQAETIETLPDLDAPLAGQSIRGVFARSLCTAHHMGSIAERSACDDGVPCTKLANCLAMADKTLVYLEYRHRLPKDE
ncbi:MAG: hypothetical protein OEY84_02045 [Rhodospirillaceae bacterium]|nr:hypothetical protein [Rhodospirillaceae bacterium]